MTTIVVGFLVGTTTHLFDIIVQGQDLYEGAPGLLRWFFVSLVVIDPTVCALLIWKPRLGIVVAVEVMVVDVPANWYLAATIDQFKMTDVLHQPMLLLQTLFGVLVLTAAYPLWLRFGVIDSARGARGCRI